MTSKEKRRVETKESYSNQLNSNTDNKHGNDSLILEKVPKKDIVVLSNKDKLTSSNKNTVQKGFNLFTICSTSKSVEVEQLNAVSSDGETSDNKPKKETADEVLPSTINSSLHATRSEQHNPTLIQVHGNKAMNVPKSGQNRFEETKLNDNKVERNMKTESVNTGKNTSDQKKNKKKRLNTKQDIRLVYKNQIASLNTDDPMTHSNGIDVTDTQPTVEEENDLLENAEMERMRNKQRVRAKKMKENKHSSPSMAMDKLEIAYQKAQREIDKVLQPINIDGEREQKKDQVKKTTDLAHIHGEDNEAYIINETDSLETARLKMHKLLDDAFIAISQRKPSTVMKEESPKPSSNEINSLNSKNSTEQMVQTDATMNSEKMHSPIRVIRSLKLHDEDSLSTYSPYRAYDDATLIALSNNQTHYNIVPRQQETVSTTVLKEPFSLHSKYYTSQPGEPIIIKTKNLQEKLSQNASELTASSRKDSQQSHRHQQPSLNKTSRNPVTIQNSVYDSTLARLPTADNYYELSSFQEIPTSTPIPRQAVGNKINRNLSENHKVQTEDTYNLYPKVERTVVNKYENKNYDVVDVIKESIQPGASPQPLINSIRRELQTLSNRRLTEHNSNLTKNMVNETINKRSQ